MLFYMSKQLFSTFSQQKPTLRKTSKMNKNKFQQSCIFEGSDMKNRRLIKRLYTFSQLFTQVHSNLYYISISNKKSSIEISSFFLLCC
ncbi:hypothetical protein ERO13_A06G133102v2 [Gossypium hirsutum]|uniref:Uncharacterized protein n=3 Tax=Gossypium TaxID=3633 RepID=A0A5J5VEE4_GOSBA|nr:hypothetical protein ES319_A06G143900v1 [Gossypium barbadense]KAG4195814.1 hypothetical protein ERO13_A06G133102v2 [Gossypium hirsutum]TYH13727.1 hypothetical protein ES288_A06G162200v1 [Gossypium darwinii]TYI23327.1 hypothetical protein ES332_A06G157500v1 [Gossypium tomentosum]